MKFELFYQPDTTKKRSIRSYNYAASSESTFRSNNGRLGEAKAVVNEVAIPVAVLSTLEKTALTGGRAATAVNLIPAPYLFRVVKRSGTWELAGVQALDLNGPPALIRYLRSACLPGCVSVIRSEKAMPDSAGIRYFLPQPFFLVTPNLDGSASETPISLIRI